MTRTESADLSVVVVNYNSSRFLLGLIDSLLAHPITYRGTALDVEMIVVDNASRADDRLVLESLANPRVRVIFNDENVGYARANNQGFEAASGRWHVVSNPDVLVRAGCIQALIDTIETIDGAALVGPMASPDPGMTLLMPPNEMPDPFLEAADAVATGSLAVARWRARHRSLRAFRYWSATEPIPWVALSGCFFLGRRTTILEHGLFDPDYPLYYEDMDLFRRYGESGLGLWHVPSARIVHFWSRSADTDPAVAQERNRRGAERYFEKFFGPPGLRVHRTARAATAAAAGDTRCPFDVVELGPQSAPPTLQLPVGETVFLELASNSRFFFSVGVIPSGPTWTPDRAFWDFLPGLALWCRAISPVTGDTLIAWRFTKA